MLQLFLLLIFSGYVLRRGNTQDIYSTFLQAPDLPLFSCPYQEDLISSIQFLRDERTPRKVKISNLIDLVKSSPRKIVKRKNKDQMKLETATHIPVISDNHMMNLNLTSNNETDNSKSEPMIVARNVKKILTSMQNIPQPNNEPNLLEIIRQTFENNEKSPMPIFDQTRANEKAELSGNFPGEFPVNLVPNVGQTHICNQVNANSAKNNMPSFNIPYQRVSDILDVDSFLIPETAYCDNPKRESNKNVKRDSIKSNFYNSEPGLKNAITCSESDETVAMLFKPKTISLMQVCDNLLKKIAVTVLVPYHVSKIGI